VRLFTANDYGAEAARKARAAGAGTSEAALAYNRAFTGRVYELAKHHGSLTAEWPETRTNEWERLRRHREQAEAW